MDLGRAMQLESWCLRTIAAGHDADRLFRPRESFDDRTQRNALDLD